MLAIKFKPMSNNLKKFVISLKDRTKRKETGLFVAEGYKICEELLVSPLATEFVVLSSNAREQTVELAKAFHRKGIDVYLARRQQFLQLCETETPQDILAVVRYSIEPPKIDYPIIVLDGISDPGNLGTIIRTADWFGYRTIVTSPDSVDKYNPKVIRGSMGSFFRVNVVQNRDLSDFLVAKKKEAKIFAATLSGKIPLNQIDFPKKTIIIFGNESRGIRPEILSLADFEFIIEGEGFAESLNVAISAGIVLYKYFLSQNEKK